MLTKQNPREGNELESELGAMGGGLEEPVGRSPYIANPDSVYNQTETETESDITQVPMIEDCSSSIVRL